MRDLAVVLATDPWSYPADTRCGQLWCVLQGEPVGLICRPEALGKTCRFSTRGGLDRRLVKAVGIERGLNV